jgi:hypothetical protein
MAKDYNATMFALVLLATSIAAPSPANDVCLAMVPPRLAAQITREHPAYALPLLTDSPADRLLAEAEKGSWPCPFAAVADVDGDGTLDRAVLLRHKTEPAIRLVLARHVDNGWRIDLQKDWPLNLTAAVVEPLEAGLYQQSAAGPDAGRHLDTLNSLQSDHAGFLAGQAEGAKAAFFFQNDAWQTLWLAD